MQKRGKCDKKAASATKKRGAFLETCVMFELDDV
jgi:hypothetical protein